MSVSASELLNATNWTNGITSRVVGRNESVRLFCFPHAGAGASVFRFLMTNLAPDIEVCPVQLPGREGRWQEPPLTQMSALIPLLSEALRPLLQPPFAFFGHSMGAFIAFELARRLRRENHAGPSALIVSGARAPQIPDPDPPIHAMPAEQLLNDLKRLDGIPKELFDNPEVVSLVLPTLRADLTMCETYAYSHEPALACPITTFGAEHDEKVPLDHLGPWKYQTSGAFQLQMFPGDHFYYLKEARTVWAQALREALLPSKKAAVTGLAPNAEVERLIASVWGEVLRVPHVGKDDNFFDLGGNSLLMIQAYTKLRQATNTPLSVLDLFQYPTIRSLASAMVPASAGASGPAMQKEKSL